MKQCPKCKNNISDTAKFCVKCGCNIKKYEEEQSAHFCPECGTKFVGGNFCPECGYDIRKEMANSKESVDLGQYFDEDLDILKSSSLLDKVLIDKKVKEDLYLFSYKKNKDGYVITKLIDDIETNITIPSYVVMIEEKAFENSYVVNVKLSEGLKCIGKKAFAGCKYLKKINIPKSVTRIDDEAFKDCVNLDFNLPDTVKALGENIYLNSLKDVKEKKTLLEEKQRKEKLAKEEKEFQERLKKEQEAKLLAEKKELEERQNALEKAKKEAIEFAAKEIERINREALEKKRKEEETTAINNLIKFSKIEGKKLVKHNSNSEYLIIKDDSIDSIGYMAFAGCKNLVKIIIGKGVKRIEANAFSGCYYLKKIVIPETVEFIGANAFAGCKNLESIELPDKVRVINDDTFRDCSALKNIKMSPHVMTIGKRAFSGCRYLSRIELYDVESIGDYAFENCVYLYTCIMPSRLGGPQYIGEGAFAGCKYLGDIKIPSDLKVIPTKMLYGCEKIKKLTFPKGVESMGEDCFTNCLGLEEIVFPETMRVLNLLALTNCPKLKLLKFEGTPYNFQYIAKGNFGCFNTKNYQIQFKNTKPMNYYEYMMMGYNR